MVIGASNPAVWDLPQEPLPLKLNAVTSVSASKTTLKYPAEVLVFHEIFSMDNLGSVDALSNVDASIN